MSKLSEQKGQYNVDRKQLKSKAELKRSPAMLEYSNSKYRKPTPKEVESLLHICGWTQNEVAERLGIASNVEQGSSTIRKWKTETTESNHRQIPYSAWRLWLIEAKLIPLDECYR